MAVTIRDVAEATGVSVSTVSRALSLPDMVEAGTRERVLRMADHLGYRPNRAARGLITGRTGNLGLILPDLANPFFPSIVKGIQHEAHEADYAVFIADSDEDGGAELALVKALAKQVDGAILCSPRMSLSDLREAAKTVPIVLVNRKALNLPTVSVDNAGGMGQAVEHLSELGHRRLGFLAGPRRSWSSNERLRGLRAAVTKWHVELVEIGNFPPMYEGGSAAVEATLASDVSAVIAYNDLMALGLMNALATRGVVVPDQMSIIGIDDIAAGNMVQPTLTTVSIPKNEVGRAAVHMLMQILAAPHTSPGPQQETAMRLLVRNTTAPPAMRKAPPRRPSRLT